MTVDQHAVREPQPEFQSEKPYQWMLKGLCRNFDPDRWFPTGNPKEAHKEAKEAKAVCAICPVQEECLTYALEEGIPQGIFGGTSGKQRKRMTGHRTRRCKRCGGKFKPYNNAQRYCPTHQPDPRFKQS